jgi:hypothetical protein
MAGQEPRYAVSEPGAGRSCQPERVQSRHLDVPGIAVFPEQRMQSRGGTQTALLFLPGARKNPGARGGD